MRDSGGLVHDIVCLQSHHDCDDSSVFNNNNTDMEPGQLMMCDICLVVSPIALGVSIPPCTGTSPSCLQREKLNNKALLRYLIA